MSRTARNGGHDPRDIAAYTVAEAARYVRIPPQTLRAWVVGRAYTQDSGRHPFYALISPPQSHPPQLSFNNLIEAYVLRALRTKHQVSIEAARAALDFAEQHFDIQRLLLSPALRASAGEVFLEKYSTLINLADAGQIAMRIILRGHLKRIMLDDLNLPARFYPVPTDTKNVIVIDPRIAFGRPIIARRGISTAAIVDRINAGESQKEVAKDYGLKMTEVEEALVYEQAA